MNKMLKRVILAKGFSQLRFCVLSHLLHIQVLTFIIALFSEDVSAGTLDNATGVPTGVE
jgi:hypothetical protein